MSDNQNHIEQLEQRIRRLEFQNQELQAEVEKYRSAAKNMIDAAISFEKTPRSNTELRQKRFIILKACEKKLKDIFYPKQKTSQGVIDWLSQ